MALALVTTTTTNVLAQVPCPNLHAGTVRPTGTWQYGEATVFSTSGLAVDADGAPNSYRVDGNGLSYTCDGVVALDEHGKRINKKNDPVHWQQRCKDAWKTATATGNYSKVAIFGFLTDPANGQPLVQKPGDPLPGDAYLTTTSVEILSAPKNTQRHWVDATQIPYVVLPSGFVRHFHVKPGALAIVYRPKTNSLMYAVYGDEGDFGEGSIKLHLSLQNNPMVFTGGVQRAKRGISDEVIMAIFPAQETQISSDSVAWNQAIVRQGEQAVAKLGGPAAVKQCLSK